MSSMNHFGDYNQKSLDRRGFLSGSTAAASAFSMSAVLERFLGRTAKANQNDIRHPGYGPLMPVEDETTGLPLLKLPKGFRYISFGWTRDPLSDGNPTPSMHDGMAVIQEDQGLLTLCRNHEVKATGRPIGGPEITYDSTARAGCTNLRFDANSGKWLDAQVSISGTMRNCAGGPTPWNTWLTCEETVLAPADVEDNVRWDLNRTHGWVFEVPANGTASPKPLTDMGRFVHEAIAVDPQTSIVYETEDRDAAGFYRFIPHERQQLSKGGALQMMKVRGIQDLRKNIRPGTRFDVSWVDIANPRRAHTPGNRDGYGVFQQGLQQGGAAFARLEGCWHGNGLIYFDATSGGNIGAGQIWTYDPAHETLTLVFESPDKNLLNMPDNLVVTRGGGLLVCEDNDYTPEENVQRLIGLTPDGGLFEFAANNIRLDGQRNGFRGDFRGYEWAGVCTSSNGEWIFANIQTPGITFAITGPWDSGPFSARG